ncbi:hypothetical protein [Salinisphaera orenii]|uniref:hypothetical protein n=1 Tax=Salinisphaera orenii TaxID=856731 RepID=UPI000DBE9610
MRFVRSQQTTASSLINGILVLCLLVSALSWSLHVQAADSAAATGSVVQVDDGSSGDVADASNDVSNNGMDPCSHAELHFVGILPSLDGSVTAIAAALDSEPDSRHTNPHPEPLIIPPIA